MTSKILFTALAVLCVSISSRATPIPNAVLGGFDAIYQGEYFISEDNLSAGGSDTDPLLSGNGKYTNFSNLVELGYSIRPGFRFSAGGEFALATSENGFQNRSNSEFTNLILSAQYFLGTGKFRFIPNVRASIAVNEVELGQDDVLTSEGSSRYEFGAWFRYPTWILDNYLYLGYIYQEDGKADLLDWSLGTQLRFSKFLLRGQLNGVSVLADDAQTDDLSPSRTFTNIQTSGGSLRFNSINPSYIEFETVLEYELDPTMRFGGGIGHTITGKNYGFGLSVLLSFTKEFTTGSGSIDDTDRLDGASSFQPQLEDYNEDLFK